MIHDLIGIAAVVGTLLALWLVLSRTRSRLGSWVEAVLMTATAAGWIAVASFNLLALAGWFRLGPALAVVLAGTVIALRGKHHLVPRTPATDRKLGSRLPLPLPVLVAAVPLGVVVTLRALKGLVSPQLAWDSMTYHLPKIAFWVQSGRLRLPDFPDAWTYYRYFPHGAEAIFAWPVLMTRSDALLGPAGVLIWALVVTATAVLASELAGLSGSSEPGEPAEQSQRVERTDRGSDLGATWAVGLAIGALPALLAFATATYSDTLLGLAVVLAVLYTVRFLRGGRTADFLAAAAPTGLMLAIKISSAPTAGLLLALLAAGWIRHRGTTLAAAAGIVLAAGPNLGYLEAWLAAGSPFYPFKAPLLDGLPYHEALHRMLSGAFDMGDHVPQSAFEIARALFWGAPPGPGNAHLNFGLGGLLLAALAVGGAVRGLLWHRSPAEERAAPSARGAVILLFLVAASALPAFLGEGSLGLRTFWIDVMARGLLAFFLPLLTCAALLPAGWRTGGVTLSLLASAVHYLPLGWSPAMTGPALVVAVATILAVSVWLALRRRLRAGPSRFGPLGLAAGVLAAGAFLAGWLVLRDRVRHSILAETTAASRAYDAHLIGNHFALMAPVWRALDRPEGGRIAVVVAPDKAGHNQFLFPLFGARLQNELVWVPVTAAKSESSLEPVDRYRNARPDLWLERLARLRVDAIVGLWPATPERDWLTRQPERYEVRRLHASGAPWVAYPRTAAGPGDRRHGRPSSDGTTAAAPGSDETATP